MRGRWLLRDASRCLAVTEQKIFINKFSRDAYLYQSATQRETQPGPAEQAQRYCSTSRTIMF